MIVIVDADPNSGIMEGRPHHIAEALAGPDYCFHSSQNINCLVPDAAKNRLFTSEEELYVAAPEVSTIFPTSNLRAADLDGAQTVHIVGCREEYSYGTSHYVLDIDLGGESAALRLGVTLARDIKAVLGADDTDLWIGRAISIHPSQMKIKDKDSGVDKVVDVIRAAAAPEDVKPLDKAALVTRQTPNDDIPF